MGCSPPALSLDWTTRFSPPVLPRGIAWTLRHNGRLSPRSRPCPRRLSHPVHPAKRTTRARRLSGPPRNGIGCRRRSPHDYHRPAIPSSGLSAGRWRQLSATRWEDSGSVWPRSLSAHPGTAAWPRSATSGGASISCLSTHHWTREKNSTHPEQCRPMVSSQMGGSQPCVKSNCHSRFPRMT